MKSFIVFALFVAAAVAAPLESDVQAKTISQSNDNIGTGEGYNASVETSNGINIQAQGQLVDDAFVVRGQYSYTGPDGVVYTVSYVADKDGFHAQGAHLPQSP